MWKTGEGARSQGAGRGREGGAGGQDAGGGAAVGTIGCVVRILAIQVTIDAT